MSADYDSLLMNVVQFGRDRRATAAALVESLAGARVGGIRTNLATMAAILRERDFLAGATTTAYLDEHPEVLTAGVPSDDDVTAHLLAVVFADERQPRGSAPGDRLRSVGLAEPAHAGATAYVAARWSTCTRSSTSWRVTARPCSIGPNRGRSPTARCPPTIDASSRCGFSNAPTRGRCSEIDGVRRRVEVLLEGDGAFTTSHGVSLAWSRPPRFVDHDAEQAGSGPVSPLPGTVIAVHVEAGQTVADGTLLMVVEAMKMEHKITAHAAGVVREVRFTAGQRVDAGDLLVVLEATE